MLTIVDAMEHDSVVTSNDGFGPPLPDEQSIASIPFLELAPLTRPKPKAIAVPLPGMTEENCLSGVSQQITSNASGTERQVRFKTIRVLN